MSLRVCRARLFQKVGRKVVHEAVVKVLAAEVGVARGGLTSKTPSSMVRREMSKGPAAEVNKMNVLLPVSLLLLPDPSSLVVQPVGNGGRRRLVVAAGSGVVAGCVCLFAMRSVECGRWRSSSFPSCESKWVDFVLDSLDHLVSLKVQSGESPQCVEPISESEPIPNPEPNMGMCAHTGQSKKASEITRVTDRFQTLKITGSS